MVITLSDRKPRSTQALGASLAEQHLSALRTAIEKYTVPNGTLVILDFKGIQSTNGSYIKASAYWVYLCGQLSTRPDLSDLIGSRSTDPKPYDLYCAVANLSPEVEAEFDEFFGSRGLPFLIATKWNDEKVHSARIGGGIEPTLQRSLTCLLSMGKASAPEMHSRYPNENITVTAWNNRLSDLHALRLVRRVRNGRQWEYQPVTGGLIYGRSIHQCQV